MRSNSIPNNKLTHRDISHFRLLRRSLLMVRKYLSKTTTYHFFSILFIQFKSFCCLFKCLWVRKYIVWCELTMCIIHLSLLSWERGREKNLGGWELKEYEWIMCHSIRLCLLPYMYMLITVFNIVHKAFFTLFQPCNIINICYRSFKHVTKILKQEYLSQIFNQ